MIAMLMPSQKQNSFSVSQDKCSRADCRSPAFASNATLQQQRVDEQAQLQAEVTTCSGGPEHDIDLQAQRGMLKSHAALQDHHMKLH